MTQQSNGDSARLFYSYSEADALHRLALEAHLALLSRQGILSTWCHRSVAAGTPRQEEVDQRLEQADIILLLVSASFLASEYCAGAELGKAMRRHDAGSATVIPIIIRPCRWTTAPFGALQALPRNGRPVSRWTSKDAAWCSVADEIARVAQAIITKRAPTALPTTQAVGSQRTKWVICFKTQVDAISNEQLQQLTKLLQEFSGDVCLSIERVSKGSLNIHLDISLSGAKRLQEACHDDNFLRALVAMGLSCDLAEIAPSDVAFSQPASAEQVSSADFSWVLIVVNHDNQAHIGAAVTLQHGARHYLGRNTDLFASPVFASPEVSRRHATLEVHTSSVVLTNTGKHGTVINGERREEHTLVDGDVVAIGPVLLLLRRMAPRASLPNDSEFLGRSTAIASLLQQISIAADATHPVLIRGETGTGKSLVAHRIHLASVRRAQPYVQMSAAELSSSSMAEELFGAAKGAWSGGPHREGLLKRADGGTALLEDVEHAVQGVQGALLRYMESQLLWPIGALHPIGSNVRLIFTSTADLDKRVAAGEFMIDLYRRMSAYVIEVTPLRDRIEDIPLLARHFADRAGAVGRPFSHEFMLALLRHSWPGNVRELRLIVADAVTRASFADEQVSGSSASLRLLGQAAAYPRAPESIGRRTDVPLEVLRDALRQHHGRARGAAAQLGMSVANLYRLIRMHGIEISTFRTKGG